VAWRKYRGILKTTTAILLPTVNIGFRSRLSYSQYDEFAKVIYGVDLVKDIVKNEKEVFKISLKELNRIL